MGKTIVLICIFVLSSRSGWTQAREYYQLLTYYVSDKQQESTVDKYLKEFYLPLLHGYGIEAVGVFKDRNPRPDTLIRCLVLVPYQSLNHLDSIKYLLEQDLVSIKKESPYLSANHENPPYVRISSTIMRAFEKMPQMKASPISVAKEDRVYEMEAISHQVKDT